MSKRNFKFAISNGAKRWQPDAESAVSHFDTEEDDIFGPSMASAHAGPLFAFKECQKLLQTLLSASWVSFFTELTGMRLHVHWPGMLDMQQTDNTLFICPAARSQCCAGSLPLNCQSCIQRFWPSANASVLQENQFEGLCGITNFCVVFKAGGSFPPLVTLVLQAIATGGETSPQPAGMEAASPVRGPARCDTRLEIPSSSFVHAIELLRMRVCELDAVVQAWLARHELEQMRELLRTLESENASLRKAVHHRLPDLPKPPVSTPFNTRAHQIVQEMIGYVHEHYHRPLSLGDVANALKMNASYISNIFSQTLGVTFHSYLEEYRLAKARELLRNPRSRVCEVACAVGYTSPDQFRHVFKERVGVPPSAWRFKAES